MATITNPHRLEVRNVVVFGRSGSGKSTVANQILGVASSDGFKVLANPSSTTIYPEKRSSTLSHEGISYTINVINTGGLFDNRSLTMKKTKDAVRKLLGNAGIHLIVFVIKEGRFTQEEEAAFRYVHDNFSMDIDPLSLVVITNCESKIKEDIISGYKSNEKTKEVLNHAKKGVIAVGFPKLEYFSEPLRQFYKERAEEDAVELRKIVLQSKVPQPMVEIPSCIIL